MGKRHRPPRTTASNNSSNGGERQQQLPASYQSLSLLSPTFKAILSLAVVSYVSFLAGLASCHSQCDNDSSSTATLRLSNHGGDVMMDCPTTMISSTEHNHNHEQQRRQDANSTMTTLWASSIPNKTTCPCDCTGIKEESLAEKQDEKDSLSSANVTMTSLNPTASSSILLSLPEIVQYSYRPMQQHYLTMRNVTIEIGDPIPSLQFQFLSKNSPRIYGIENYIQYFEGSVTYTWLSILHLLRQLHNDTKTKKYIVIDGGMNMGFYTMISALLGYNVHSFDIQLDCFDISNLLLQSNNIKHLVKLYHVGLYSTNGIDQLHNVPEGCDPGRNIQNVVENKVRQEKEQKEWKVRYHTVSTVTLDTILSSTLGSSGSSTISPSRSRTTTTDDNTNQQPPQQPQQEQSPPTEVAILKMDIEGAEIAALQGLSKENLLKIQNIILECSPSRIQRLQIPMKDIIHEFQRLQYSGMKAYLLYQPKLPPRQFYNTTYLVTTTGIRPPTIPPTGRHEENDDILPNNNNRTQRRQEDSWYHPLWGKNVSLFRKDINEDDNAKNMQKKKKQPFMGSPTNLVQWEVLSWKKLLKGGGVCSIACNLWFTRMV